MHLIPSMMGFCQKEWDILVIIFLSNPIPWKVGKNLHGGRITKRLCWITPTKIFIDCWKVKQGSWCVQKALSMLWIYNWKKRILKQSYISRRGIVWCMQYYTKCFKCYSMLFTVNVLTTYHENEIHPVNFPCNVEWCPLNSLYLRVLYANNYRSFSSSIWFEYFTGLGHCNLPIIMEKKLLLVLFLYSYNTKYFS